MSVAKVGQRALRPIAISNRELLDADSYFTVLRAGLQENLEFVLVPQSAWRQLSEWYGGGPAIARKVVCTEKAIRVKALQFSMARLRAEFAQRQARLAQSAKKDKKTKIKETKTSEEFESEFKDFVDGISGEIRADSLRVDLYPMFCNVATVSAKGGTVSEEAME